MKRLDDIATSGRCQDRELQALKQQVNALQRVMNNISSQSRLLQDIKSLLDRPRTAVDKVLQNKVLDALRFEEMHRRNDNIEEAHVDTFRWLLDDEKPSSKRKQTLLSRYPGAYSVPFDEHIQPLRLQAQARFLDWLGSGKGVFHISGKPGAGKSTLMKYLAESSKTQLYLQSWAGNKQVIFATFYFWRHGTDYQKSLGGLLRSLLYSVLAQCPELVSAIFPTQWEAAQDGLTIHFHKPEIQRAFDALMKQPGIYHGRKLVFFIDGLDEFEGHDASLVSALLDWAHSGLDNIKICVSSRELPIFQQRFSTCPKFRLHEITYHDIIAFVDDRLQKNEDAKSLHYELEDVLQLGGQLVGKADGVFLWVTLALSALEQGLLNGDSVPLLKEKIDFLPTEVEELFDHIFHSIQKELHPIERRRAMRILSIFTHQIALASNFRYSHRITSIDLLQLSFLDEYTDRDPNFSARFTGAFSDLEIGTRLARWHKLVESSCMGLVSINPGYKYRGSTCRFRSHEARLAHRSLIEFLGSSDVRAQIERHTGDFDFLQFSCQSLLAELKVSASPYLDQFQVVRTGYSEFGFKSRTPLPKTANFTPPDALAYRDNYFKSSDFESDKEWIISIYYAMKDSDMSTLLSTLNQLAKVADNEIYPTPPPYSLYLYIPQGWNGDGSSSSAIIEVDCTASEFCRWKSVKFGIDGFWPMDDEVGAASIYFKKTVTMFVVLSSIMGGPGDASSGIGIPTFSKLLQTTSFALEKGVSPNAELQPLAEQSSTFSKPRPSSWMHPSFTQWYLLIWDSILRTKPRVPMQAVWLLFLIHGADTNFWLTFEEIGVEYNEGSGQARQLRMSGQFGTERLQLFTPVTVGADYGSIVELAKEQGWTVSLEDITRFWFPDHAEEFRTLIHLNESRIGDPSAEELRGLRQRFGFDPNAWQNREWKIPKPLLRCWSGSSYWRWDSERKAYT